VRCGEHAERRQDGEAAVHRGGQEHERSLAQRAARAGDELAGRLVADAERVGDLAVTAAFERAGEQRLTLLRGESRQA
jgi:hypothetical protein